MKAKKRSRAVNISRALTALTPEQLDTTKVRYTFTDGTSETTNAAGVKATIERQTLALRRIQGAQAAHSTKAPADVARTILLKFGDYWLMRNEHYPLLRARAHARAWIVRQTIEDNPGISLATARRWVSDSIGKKTPMPKSYYRRK